ncbi:MAG: hypothetical protein BA872_05825 [Desulfobacterales bacterium C00003060]|nr:MAG: hypothetical protein BA872_05825 [Desulfobacterales bacterium C00003060]OEU84337.1 MAG: hypothetical protein BA865_10885 [Desulfobacterales bacterium S5133MH4]
MKNMRRKSIKLIIESNLENVALVARAVKSLCALVPVESSRIELCIAEAVTNSIEHAYGSEEGHHVEVVFTIGWDELILSVYDTGIPMDPKLLGEKGPSSFLFNADDLESVPRRGRGLAIIKEVMDNVTYTLDKGRNCFTMTKKIS